MPAEPPPAKAVLVVEDSIDTRDSLAFLLRHVGGYQVSTAANGQEALDRLRAGPRPGLILLDLLMPTMNGWEFCHRLRQDPALASIPVVVVSNVGDSPEEVASLRPAACLAKTADLATLLDTVRRHCAGGPDEGCPGGGY
jgi:CheY-like chemotaxis protein